MHQVQSHSTGFQPVISLSRTLSESPFRHRGKGAGGPALTRPSMARETTIQIHDLVRWKATRPTSRGCAAIMVGDMGSGSTSMDVDCAGMVGRMKAGAIFYRQSSCLSEEHSHDFMSSHRLSVNQAALVLVAAGLPIFGNS